MAKFNIDPALIIFVSGFFGLLFIFVESSGEVGGKLPLALFFIVIISFGIILKMFPPEKFDEVYGESGREIG